MIKPIGKITPYPFQHEVIQNCLGHIRDQFSNFKETKKSDNAFVNASVSSGKTIMMGAIANHCKNVGVKSMILTAVGELAGQDGEECFNMDTPCSYFSAYMGRKSTHFPTVVGTVGTVANALTKDFAAWAPHVLMIDECHLIDHQDDECKSQFMQVITHFKQLNPMMVVIGFTGTPWRGSSTIKGEFWKREIEPVIDRQFLMDNGYTVPDVFGFTDHEYDLGDEFAPGDDKSMSDFSDNQLAKMHKLMNPTATQEIMLDVIRLCESRNGVLITCAGESHCKEAAAALPDKTWAIVTSVSGVITQTGYKTRKEVVDAVKDGKIKYLLQVGCFTTGFNAPIIDTIVLLRRIGSLVLLEQLLGRGRRLLKPHQAEAGIVKNESLVLDFSGTMAAMSDLYNNPVLEEAMKAKDNFEKNFVTCPDCETLNGEHARRCCGDDHKSDDGRCEFFFKSRRCEDVQRGGIVVSNGCGAENDIAARDCRKCGNQLIDPNAKLDRKHYSDQDWKPVLSMELEVIGPNQDGIGVKYFFDNYGEDGKQEIANIKYWAIKGGGKRVWTSGFIRRHIVGYPFQQRVISMTPVNVIKNKALFSVPTMATHRLNDKGHSVVHGLKFSSGLTIKGSKRIDNQDEE